MSEWTEGTDSVVDNCRHLGSELWWWWWSEMAIKSTWLQKRNKTMGKSTANHYQTFFQTGHYQRACTPSQQVWTTTAKTRLSTARTMLTVRGHSSKLTFTNNHISVTPSVCLWVKSLDNNVITLSWYSIGDGIIHNYACIPTTTSEPAHQWEQIFNTISPIHARTSPTVWNEWTWMNRSTIDWTIYQGGVGTRLNPIVIEDNFVEQQNAQGSCLPLLGDGLCWVYDPPIRLYGKLSMFGLHLSYSVWYLPLILPYIRTRALTLSL